MSKFEAILKEAEALSVDERAQLVALLIDQATSDATCDDEATSRRGLSAWTESARQEDWSEFYPDALRNGRGGSR